MQRDVDALYAMRSDETWAFFGAPGPVSRSAVALSVERAVGGAWADGPYFVITRDGAVVGDVVLQVDRPDATANLGYAVARPHWGHGIAKEAAGAVVAHGFRYWDLEKIHARVDPRNLASVRVLESIPMRLEGTLRRHVVRRGERVDRLLYGLLRDEWARTEDDAAAPTGAGAGVGAGAIRYAVRPALDESRLQSLFEAAWGGCKAPFAPVLARSFTWVSAEANGDLVGFVNVAWDGGVHFFLLDTTVRPDWQRRGVGRRLVEIAVEACRGEGEWMHVDSDGDLMRGFYGRCGFSPTAAGLLRLD